MPELPDLSLYVEQLNERLTGATFEGLRLASPFVLRTVAPEADALAGLKVLRFSRLAKQLVCHLDQGFAIVVHLMISGRLQWQDAARALPKRGALAAFDFDRGSVLFTEASKKKRASIRLVAGAEALAALDPGGLEVVGCELAVFAERLRQANHTLKRALTDQRVLAGIGNAYSDEILLAARLSPFKRPRDLSDDDMLALYDAVQHVLTTWTSLLRQKAGGQWPKKVTAFHDEMAVHGKYRQPCPVCSKPVQRIVYAENEANYCAHCQTGGRLLADRSLSRLLKDNWPKRLEDLEQL